MEEVVYHLFAHSYDGNHISRKPTVLNQRPHVIQDRLIELRRLGHLPKSLSVLCRSEIGYRRYVQKITEQKHISQK